MQPASKEDQNDCQLSLFQSEIGILDQEVETIPLEGKVEGLRLCELAVRLRGGNESTIRSWQRKGARVLAEKTQSLDPDAIAWRFDEEKKKYFPLRDNPIN